MLILAAAASLPAADDTIVRVPEPEAKKALVTRVDPGYPPMAKQMRLANGKAVKAVAAFTFDFKL
jgi:hypothetical protein